MVLNENRSNDDEHINTYQIIILPIIFCIFASLAPEPSYILIIGCGGYILLAIIGILIARVKKWHRFIRFRLIFGFIQIDLTALLVAILILRVLKISLGLFVILIILLLASVLIGHKLRFKIIEELKQPKTLLGKLLVSFGFLGSGLAGILSYSVTQFVSGIITAGFMYALMLLVVLIAHAQWR